jgi:hypothetical protein
VYKSYILGIRPHFSYLGCRKFKASGFLSKNLFFNLFFTQTCLEKYLRNCDKHIHGLKNPKTISQTEINPKSKIYKTQKQLYKYFFKSKTTQTQKQNVG